jgi:hypothetical protein
MQASIDTREEQLEYLRDYINVKIESNKSLNDLYLLCGDINIDS